MPKIRLYIEGGKPTKQPAKEAIKDNDRELRLGFQEFFRKALDNKLLDIKCCGSGSDTCKRFVSDTESKQEPDVIKFLVVDSEMTVLNTDDRRSHLKKTHGQGVAQKLSKIEEKYCHLMVQEMEAWFLADEKALETVFPNDFKVGKIPKIQNVEMYDKEQVNDILYAATNGKYLANNKKRPTEKETKLRYAGRILKELDPEEVAKKSKHCQKLLEALKEFTS